MADMDIPYLVGTIGFPIVAYLLMFFKLSKDIQELTSVITKLCEGLHKDE